MPWITIGLWLVAAIAVVLALVYGPRILLGLVIIGDDEVGIVTKKFEPSSRTFGTPVDVAPRGVVGILPSSWASSARKGYELELLFGTPPVPTPCFGLAQTTTARFGCV